MKKRRIGLPDALALALAVTSISVLIVAYDRPINLFADGQVSDQVPAPEAVSPPPLSSAPATAGRKPESVASTQPDAASARSAVAGHAGASATPPAGSGTRPRANRTDRGAKTPAPENPTHGGTAQSSAAVAQSAAVDRDRLVEGDGDTGQGQPGQTNGQAMRQLFGVITSDHSDSVNGQSRPSSIRVSPRRPNGTDTSPGRTSGVLTPAQSDLMRVLAQ